MKHIESGYRGHMHFVERIITLRLHAGVTNMKRMSSMRPVTIHQHPLVRSEKHECYPSYRMSYLGRGLGDRMCSHPYSADFRRLVPRSIGVQHVHFFDCDYLISCCRGLQNKKKPSWERTLYQKIFWNAITVFSCSVSKFHFSSVACWLTMNNQVGTPPVTVSPADEAKIAITPG